MPSIICSTALIAHQGGWDEILLVGVPILLIIGLLAVAKRRVDAQVAARQHDADAGHVPESVDGTAIDDS